MTHRLQDSADAVTLEPAARAAASVIWLHGLGADGHDFVPIIPELKLPAAPAIRFVFPHAPVRPVTLNNGMRMRAWYDLKSLTAEGRADEAGIRDSARRLGEYVARERATGVDSTRIVVAGFSQGGAVALHAGLRQPEPLGGILALSAYLPLAASLPAERAEANQKTPILMCHGRFDPVLSYDYGIMGRDALLALDYSVEWKEYPMQHQVCLPEIQEISRWLQSRLMVPGRGFADLK